MSLWMLVAVLLAMWAMRIAFLAANFSDLERLWYDFERRGVRFRLARLIDYSTLTAFLVCAVLALWKQYVHDASWLGKFFISWLGWSLLERLPTHRFPRTNRQGAYEEAKMNLFVNSAIASIGACVVTVAAWAYLSWRG
jgi:hypothetical protein